MKIGSLFTGIGGLDLGLERAGHEIAFQVEIDDFCSHILKGHWPHTPRYGDITKIRWGEVPRVDVLVGGFPCQDISDAGNRAGISGSRSGLWSEMVRAIRVVRPLRVLVENVAALLRRGMGRVLGDLAASRYDAEWDCLPAVAFGADHQRDRVFVVAYPHGERRSIFQQGAPRGDPPFWQLQSPWGEKRYFRDSSLERRREDSLRRAAELGILPMVDGVPEGMDHALKAVGNAVIPQVGEWIGPLL